MRAILFALALGLAGCAAAPHLSELRRLQPRGGNFSETLAREYRSFALQRSANGSWQTAEHFAAKGLAALAGAPPEPEPVDSRLPEATRMELEKARVRLVQILGRGAAERYPPFAAVALARFDCWVDRSPVWPEAAEAARCRREFEENMATLEEAFQRSALIPGLVGRIGDAASQATRGWTMS